MLPQGFEALPPAVQVIAILISGAIVAATVINGYLKARSGEPPARDVVLSAGTIADMTPVREAAAHLKRIADGIEAMNAAAADRAKAETNDRLEEMETLLQLMNERLNDRSRQAPEPSHHRRRPHRPKG